MTLELCIGTRSRVIFQLPSMAEDFWLKETSFLPAIVF